MIIVRLMGGLGNQMFQYAVGRSLSILHGVPLQLDISGYRTYSLHAYRLDRLMIRADLANEAGIERLRSGGAIGRRVVELLGWAGLAPAWIKERSLRFDPTLLHRKPPLYLEGYWQSEKYFIANETLLRAEFALREPMDARNREMVARITDCDSVAVHVRRGDYVTNPLTNAVHGVCEPAYYERACALLMETVTRPQGFVFSDDPAWARENLRLPFPATVVDFNGDDRNYLDLYLIAACRHQIIANSSFSWWAAWLNSNPAKVVVAPRRWFRQADIDTRDLLPEGWLRA